MRALKRFIIAISLGWLTAATSSASAQEGAGRPDPRALTESIFAPAVAEGRLVGVAVGVIRDGEATEVYLGMADPETGRKVGDETLFEIASISKTFTGLILAELINEGRARPETTLGELLEGEPVPSPEAAAITLERLITQSSGLTRMPWNFHPADNDNPYADYSREKIREFLAKPKFAHKTGEAYLYSNVGFGALGLALEAVSGRDYESLVAERVFAPLGMTRSRVSLDKDGLAALARPHNEKGRAVSRWDLPGPMAACGGVRSTLPDMLRYLRAQIDANLGVDGPLADSIKLSQRAVFRASDRLRLAYAWHLVHRTDLGREIAYHNGETGGFHSFIGFLPGEGVGIVALSNSAVNFDTMAVRTMAALAGVPIKPSE